MIVLLLSFFKGIFQEVSSLQQWLLFYFLDFPRFVRSFFSFIAEKLAPTSGRGK